MSYLHRTTCLTQCYNQACQIILRPQTLRGHDSLSESMIDVGNWTHQCDAPLGFPGTSLTFRGSTQRPPAAKTMILAYTGREVLTTRSAPPINGASIPPLHAKSIVNISGKWHMYETFTLEITQTLYHKPFHELKRAKINLSHHVIEYRYTFGSKNLRGHPYHLVSARR